MNHSRRTKVQFLMNCLIISGLRPCSLDTKNETFGINEIRQGNLAGWQPGHGTIGFQTLTNRRKGS